MRISRKSKVGSTVKVVFWRDRKIVDEGLTVTEGHKGKGVAQWWGVDGDVTVRTVPSQVQTEVMAK